MLHKAPLTKILERVSSPKSRRTGRLTPNEIEQITGLLDDHQEEIFTPDEPTIWYGLDYPNEMVYQADTAEEILEAWKENQQENLDREAVEVNLGEGALLVQIITGIGEGERAEIYLVRSDVLPSWGLEIDADGKVVKTS